MDQAETTLTLGKREDEPFRPKPLPILIAAVTALGIAFVSFVTVEFLKLVIRLPEYPLMPWISNYYFFGAELAYTLLVMRLLAPGHFEEFGLRRPEGHDFVLTAVLWCAPAGLLLTLVEYWPLILNFRRPDQPYPLTVLNIVGWVSFAGVFVGIVEELLFRGLIFTALAKSLPGRITYRNQSVSGAAVVVAAIYALSYSESLLDKPFIIALLQMFIAFALGVAFASWYERSKSLLAPIVGHNVASLMKQLVIFGMVAAWR